MSKLSVGQKQRIAITRGLLRDSRILILDEPTSALDPETEEYLVRALKDAARDRLVVVVAHRLATTAGATVEPRSRKAARLRPIEVRGRPRPQWASCESRMRTGTSAFRQGSPPSADVDSLFGI